MALNGAEGEDLKRLANFIKNTRFYSFIAMFNPISLGREFMKI